MIWSWILGPICPPQCSGWCRLILGLAVNNYLSNNAQVCGADKIIAPDWVGPFPILNCKYQPCMIFTGGCPDRDFWGRLQILVTGKRYLPTAILISWYRPKSLTNTSQRMVFCMFLLHLLMSAVVCNLVMTWFQSFQWHFILLLVFVIQYIRIF